MDHGSSGLRNGEKEGFMVAMRRCIILRKVCGVPSRREQLRAPRSRRPVEVNESELTLMFATRHCVASL